MKMFSQAVFFLAVRSASQKQDASNSSASSPFLAMRSTEQPQDASNSSAAAQEVTGLQLRSSVDVAVGWQEVWTCPDTGDHANIDHCGGNDDASCTPFPVKAWPDVGKSCGNPDDRIIGGGGMAVGGWQVPNSNSFFIFHSCDGAGLQTDCMVQEMYVEQFSFATCPNNDWSKCSHACNVLVPGSKDGSGAQHQQCSFYHPGKQTFYEWYNCGWWLAKNQFADFSYFGWNEFKTWFQTWLKKQGK